MKLFIATLLALHSFIASNAQLNTATDSFKTISVNISEPELKQYWFVMLKKGPNRNQDSAAAAQIQERHMANISRLATSGKLLVAGPFGDDGNWKGIFIFDCKEQAEAENLLKTDAAISSGRLAYEIHPWWTAKNAVFK